MIPLALLNEDDRAEIVQINGGRNVVLRMNELGFSKGTEIRVIRNVGGGPVLVELKAGKLAVGRGVAMKIICKKIISRE